MREEHPTEPIAEAVLNIDVLYKGWEEHYMVDRELDKYFVHKLYYVFTAAFEGLTISQDGQRD